DHAGGSSSRAMFQLLASCDHLLPHHFFLADITYLHHVHPSFNNVIPTVGSPRSYINAPLKAKRYQGFQSDARKGDRCVRSRSTSFIVMVLNTDTWRNETPATLCALQVADRFGSNPKHSRQWVKVI